MVGRIAEPHMGRSRPPWRCLWFLAIPTLLAGFAGLIGPKVFRYLGEKNDRLLLAEEAKRLGGWAGVPEGGFDFKTGTASIEADFGHSTLTDDTFEKISSLPAFQHVISMDLSDTQISDRSIDLLKGNLTLLALDLSRTGITDRSIEALSTTPWLSTLRMSGTKVTDAGLEILRKRRSPRPPMMLDVTDTPVTEEGVRKLFREFGQWNIIYGSSKSPKTTR